jgi:hypothetical protein
MRRREELQGKRIIPREKSSIGEVKETTFALPVFQLISVSLPCLSVFYISWGGCLVEILNVMRIRQ